MKLLQIKDLVCMKEKVFASIAEMAINFSTISSINPWHSLNLHCCCMEIF
uniref:Uncharacterized protein n=1 Tax=Ascaris lumbricoides TaxID=6252 RepID=A0A0M3HZE3_ASCLU